jgi:hypothetical protein
MPINSETLRLLVAVVNLLFGAVFLIAGLRKMLAAEYSPAMRALAVQSAKISQKSLTEDMAQIAQAASKLCDSVTRMVRTSSGSGAFLVLVGMVFLGSSYLMIA